MRDRGTAPRWRDPAGRVPLPPGRAPARPASRAALLRRSKAELVTLVQLMLERRPDLHSLLDLPVPGARSRRPGTAPARTSRSAVTRDRIRGQVQGVFEAYDGDWRSAATVVDGLRTINLLGHQYAAAGDAASALTVYAALVEEALPRVEEVHDEGEVGEVLSDAVEALAGLLGAAPIAEAPGALTRAQVLRLLADVVCDDVDGSGSLAERAVEGLRSSSNPEERRTICDRLRAMVPPWAALPAATGTAAPGSGGAPRGTDWSRANGPGGWRREHVADLVLRLLADDLDDESYLGECRAVGHLQRLVDRLLQRGRFDEAVAEMEAGARVGAAAGKPWQPFADALIGNGAGTLADAYVERRLAAAFEPEPARWLAARHAGRGAWAAALDLRERGFAAVPTLEDYRAAREAASRLGSWSEVRPRLVAAGRDTPSAGVLAECLLSDGDVAGAVAALATPGGGIATGTLERVAAAAASDRPREALPLYRRLAEGAIGGRKRESYRSAVGYLVAGRRAAEAAAEGPAWHAYVDGLLQQHRILRAFQEEAQAAGLAPSPPKRRR